MFGAHHAAVAIALITPDPRSADTPLSVMFDLGQAAAYMMLAAWELGIGSVPAVLTAFLICFFPIVVNVQGDLPLLEARIRPVEGIPDSPRGWLLTVASRRMTDHVRAESARRRREETAAARQPGTLSRANARGARVGSN